MVLSFDFDDARAGVLDAHFLLVFFFFDVAEKVVILVGKIGQFRAF